MRFAILTSNCSSLLYPWHRVVEIHLTQEPGEEGNADPLVRARSKNASDFPWFLLISLKSPDIPWLFPVQNLLTVDHPLIQAELCTVEAYDGDNRKKEVWFKVWFGLFQIFQVAKKLTRNRSSSKKDRNRLSSKEDRNRLVEHRWDPSTQFHMTMGKLYLSQDP